MNRHVSSVEPSTDEPSASELSAVEDRLRAAYRAAADTIEPEGIAGLNPPVTAGRTRSRGRSRGRSPAGRGRVLVPLAAAAAIVTIAVGVPAMRTRLPAAAPRATAVPQATVIGTGRTLPGPAARGPAIPPGAPPFYVTAPEGANTVVVFAAATGKTVATVPAPHSGDNFYGIAATGDPSLYVAAVGHAYQCGTHLYSLRLGTSGQFAGWRPLSVPSLPEDMFSLAVTPDSHYLAYAGEYCAGPDAGTGDIGFLNTAGAIVRRWTTPGNEDIASLSLSASGSQIGFVIQQTKLYVPLAGVLPTDRPAGPVAEQAVWHYSVPGTSGRAPYAAAVTPDGGRFYVCEAAGGSAPDLMVTFSLRDLAVSAMQDHVAPSRKPTASKTLAGSGPCALSLDPSGRFLLAETAGGDEAGSQPTMQLIDTRTGTVTSLPAGGISGQQGVWATW